MEKIIPAGPEHLPGLMEVWEELALYHADIDERSFGIRADGKDIAEDFYGNRIRDENWYIPVAVSDGIVTGYCSSYISWQPPVFELLPRGEISDIAVRSSCRRRGIGTRLLSSVRDWFNVRGIFRIELMVAEMNPPGRKFWEANGFTPYLRKMYIDEERR